MSSGVFDDETFVALHSLVHVWLFDCPLSYISPLLIILGILKILLGMGRLPSALPVVCELLEEWSFERCRLEQVSTERYRNSGLLTVKVGSAVADSTADDTLEDASVATLDAPLETSDKTDWASP